MQLNFWIIGVWPYLHCRQSIEHFVCVLKCMSNGHFSVAIILTGKYELQSATIYQFSIIHIWLVFDNVNINEFLKFNFPLIEKLKKTKKFETSAKHFSRYSRNWLVRFNQVESCLPLMWKMCTIPSKWRSNGMGMELKIVCVALAVNIQILRR